MAASNQVPGDGRLKLMRTRTAMAAMIIVWGVAMMAESHPTQNLTAIQLAIKPTLLSAVTRLVESGALRIHGERARTARLPLGGKACGMPSEQAVG